MMGIMVTLIRHGKTAGNLRGAYIGRTDEPLCPEGVTALLQNQKAGFYPAEPGILWASPMRRCLDTAGLLYPGREARLVPDFRETDFGEFEGKSYADLDGNPDYQRFIDSGGETAFPGGEEPAAFRARCAAAFYTGMAKAPDGSAVTICCHGGTIMAILAAVSAQKRAFYDWQVPNGGGFCGAFDPQSGLLHNITPLQGKKEA